MPLSTIRLQLGAQQANCFITMDGLDY